MLKDARAFFVLCYLRGLLLGVYSLSGKPHSSPRGEQPEQCILAYKQNK